jgi:glycosyltransferase involved in cell wall biosynthesis
MQTLFSVIIPTYNRGYILWKTIQSIQRQTLPTWELLIVDDGSTDDTKKVVREFQADPRIHYFYKQNGGTSSARNFGLDRAISDIITYVDSDDEIFPDYLQAAKNHLEKYPDKSFALARAKRFLEFYDEEGVLKASKPEVCEVDTPTLQDFYDWSVKASIGTGFFHRKSLKGKVIWNENLRLLENLDFIMQCGLADPSGFLYIPHELYEYKQKYGGDGICSNASYKQWADAFAQIYNLHKNDPLMRNPSVYQQRIEKYLAMQVGLEKGEITPPKFKFFPELYEQRNQLVSNPKL